MVPRQGIATLILAAASDASPLMEARRRYRSSAAWGGGATAGADVTDQEIIAECQVEAGEALRRCGAADESPRGPQDAGGARDARGAVKSKLLRAAAHMRQLADKSSALVEHAPLAASHKEELQRAALACRELAAQLQAAAARA